MAKRQSTDPEPSQELSVIQDPEAEAFRLKLQGLSHSEIAQQELGYPDAVAVGRAIKNRMRKEARMLPTETRESLVELELMRLDYVQSIAWPRMGVDDKASATVLNCIKLRIQLLGLDLQDVGGNAQTVLVIQGDEAKYIEALKSATEPVDN